MDEYIIIGDTKKYKDCLVFVCGKDKKVAQEMLNQIKTNPTENDLRLMNGHTNFRLKKVKSEDCWWNDPFLAN